VGRVLEAAEMYGVRYTSRRSCRISPKRRGDAGDEKTARHRGRAGASDMGGEETYDVGGSCSRAFQIARIGPVRLFTEEWKRWCASTATTWPTINEEINYKSTTACSCARTPSTTPWRSIRLALRRGELRLRADTTLLSFGLQLGSYKQLKDAIAFLKENGVTIKYLPPELFPGIDYCAFAIDPDGFAFQLYLLHGTKSSGTADRGPSRSAWKSTTRNAEIGGGAERHVFWESRFWGHWGRGCNECGTAGSLND